jgi:hypothetical protein
MIIFYKANYPGANLSVHRIKSDFLLGPTIYSMKNIVLETISMLLEDGILILPLYAIIMAE